MCHRGAERREGHLFYWKAFAALKEDGTVAAWGYSWGTMEAVVCHRGKLSGVKTIYSTGCLCCPEGRRHGGSMG